MGRGAECDFLRTPDMLELIKSCKNKGYTYVEISKIIEEKTGRAVSKAILSKLLNQYIDHRKNLVAKDKELTLKMREEVINISAQLQELNSKLWEIINNLDTKDPQNINSLIRLSESILKQLEFQAKRLGELSQPNKIEISNIEFSMRVNQHIHKLEQEGYIKFLKKPKLVIESQKEKPLMITTESEGNTNAESDGETDD